MPILHQRLPRPSVLLAAALLVLAAPAARAASYLLVPMDLAQGNHLRAYGVAFHTLQAGDKVTWLLNYRGGSFLCDDTARVRLDARLLGVDFEELGEAQVAAIRAEVKQENMDEVLLETPPRIAVYSPPNKQPWDDAVTLALTYAEVPYDVVYDPDVLAGKLNDYDWLHLHHEDFTGQYGKFWRSYRNAAWYQEMVRESEEMAASLGFAKVSEMKLGVALAIRDYVVGGGYLFTMCSGTDSYDIALAAEGVDICGEMFDGDPMDPAAQQKLDFSKTFAFRDFQLETNPMVYEFSNIDATDIHGRIGQERDFFTLFDFSAKWDIVPTMLCQSHEQVVRGFMGQTTAFRGSLVKPGVTIMGENKAQGTVKYIHGEFGLGQWTFYGGHDPEDYQHMVGDPPTDLSLHPNSSGYRLILNNILFPAARKKKQKT